MAKLPIEVLTNGAIPQDHLAVALKHANLCQNEFSFDHLGIQDSQIFRMHLRRENDIEKILDKLKSCKEMVRGFHPMIVAIVDTHLYGEGHNGVYWNNLFGHHHAANGVAVFTIANVGDIILPTDRLAAYFVYYFARWTFSFIVPSHKSHDDPRGCVFDFKANKTDIVKSMKSGSV